MTNYYTYLPVSPEDEQWGLCVLNTGCTHIEPSSAYPFKTHPTHHYFNWNRGRVLDEYQIIYITRGQGIFESNSCQQYVVKAGTIIILFPGERHRYKPSPETGWDEYWIGIKGEIIDKLIARSFFTPENPCFYVGFNESIFNIFSGIIDKTKLDHPGCQPLISGAAFHLMGSFYAVSRQQSAQLEDKDMVVNKAKLLFRSHAEDAFSPEKAAEELQVGYSWFRKVFKSQTGFSPGEYFMQIKMEKARELLGGTRLSIKEIAYQLTFDSSHYFCKVFKERSGLTPTEYREKISGNDGEGFLS